MPHDPLWQPISQQGAPSIGAVKHDGMLGIGQQLGIDIVIGQQPVAWMLPWQTGEKALYGRTQM
jgi:hypothetical protein